MAKEKEERIPVTRKRRSFSDIADLGFGDFINSLRDDLLYRFPDAVRKPQFPRVDVKEDTDKFVLYAAVPEVKKEDINIEVDEDTVTVSGEQAEKKQKREQGNWLRKEQYCGSFSRTFAMPVPVNTEKVSARCRNGILAVELPKKESSKRKSVEIE